MSLETFAARFKEAREKKNITIKALQPLVGASPSALNGYATGKTQPPLDVAMKIAKELDVSLDWLCGLKEIEDSSPQFNTCADIAIALDRIAEKFEDASIETFQDEVNNEYGSIIRYVVDIRIVSEALYDYYGKLASTNEYLKNLPDNMRNDFIPYKIAMEKQLQKQLVSVPDAVTGFRFELPF